MASSIILTNLSAKGIPKRNFDQFECKRVLNWVLTNQGCKSVTSMEFWPIWVQKGYLNGVLTNLSWPTWVQKSLLNGVLTNLSAKGLVQWNLTNLSAKGLVQRSFDHQFECKKVISMEFWPIWVQMASSIILTNLSAKGTSKWYFDQFECKMVLRGILTNLSAKGFINGVLINLSAKRAISMKCWPIWVQKD